jgi:2-haloacid dehalogenase
MPANIILACDIYGTFLDTSAIASALQKNLGIFDSITSSKAKEIAQEWRKYQLEFVPCFPRRHSR